MGTTTIYTRHNDLKFPLDKMTKKELKELSQLSPYKEKNRFKGWEAPLELHNGNIHVLVWWRGRLMRLEEAPEKLAEKYYSRFKGKKLNEYEWTLLKRFVQREINSLDKEFKKHIRKKNKTYTHNKKHRKKTKRNTIHPTLEMAD